MRIIAITLLILQSLNAASQKNPDSTLLLYLNKALDTDSTGFYFSKAESEISNEKQEAIFQYYSLLNQYEYGNLDSASLYGQRAIEIFISINEKSYLRRIYHQLMSINRDRGLLEKSLKYCLEAYNLVVEAQDTAQIARYLTERSFIHHDFEQYELGIQSGKDALEIWNQHSESIDRHKVYILNAIAINFDDWNKPDSALAYYDQILAMESMKGSDELGQIYNNQGNTLLKQGRYDEAYESLQNSYKIHQGGNGDYYYYDMATVINNLGVIQTHQNHLDSAQYYLNMAEAFADSSNSFEKKRDSYFAQYQLAEKMDELTKAIDYQNKYYAIKDSIFQKDRATIIAQMEAEYETGKKEQQLALQEAELDEKKAIIQKNRIALLALITSLGFLIIVGVLWRNRLQKKQQLKLQKERLATKEAEINATISSQEKERARYARDLHDGFGQMISILNANLKNLKDGDKPNERQQVFEASSQVIDDMYDELKSICFDLMPQSLINNGLESALAEFIDRINRTGKISVELNVFGLEKRLSEIQEISLYRICQEWINNILKYSNATKVTLQITKDENEITLLIEDNGSGFDKTLLTSGKGNGWKNLNTRTNIIAGELELETRPGANGNTLIVNSPVAIGSIGAVKENTMETV